MDKIYKESIKQNNDIQKQLTGEYQTFTKDLLKQLRKYAIKSKQTEDKLKTILEEFTDAQFKGLRFTTFVPNKEAYLLEKRQDFIVGNPKHNFSKKETIGIIVFITIMLTFAILGIILKQPVKFATPANIKIEENILTFDKVEYASTYRIVCQDVKGLTIFEKVATSLDDGKTYMEINLKNYQELNSSGTYKIKIKTLATYVYEDSKWSEEIIFVFDKEA